MISYKLSNDVEKHLDGKQILVDSYESKGENISLTLFDNVSKKYLKVLFKDPKISHEEFDIKGQIVTQLNLHDFVKVFKAQYFQGAFIKIVSKNDESKSITIQGGPR